MFNASKLSSGKIFTVYLHFFSINQNDLGDSKKLLVTFVDCIIKP